MRARRASCTEPRFDLVKIQTQVGFSYPVVPNGKARIRVQLSAAHEMHHLDAAVAAFTSVGRQLGVI